MGPTDPDLLCDCPMPKPFLMQPHIAMNYV